MTARLNADYVLPLKWTDDRDLHDLTEYLTTLANWVDVTVVDGSAPGLYDEHARRWAALVTHREPEPWPGGNGKVGGVMTGLRHAHNENVIIADDDVRYDRAALESVLVALENADVVRPQNYFLRLPWHARWDTARTLINRAFGSDYPGTLAVRRSLLLDAGGYRGDVLFENLELIRTIRAAGGREVRADDLFVGRMPPTARHFARQRVRQAYDDLAQPARLIAELSLLPLLVCATTRRGRVRPGRSLPVAALLACVLAEWGRRRAGGTTVFSPTSALWAPLWLAERAVCVWAALAMRMLFGGVRYGETRLRHAATPQHTLERPGRMHNE
jgi:hypothetical protein